MATTLFSSENTLSKEKEKFEALFQYASMGILVASSTGEIILANNFLLSQFGYTAPEELIGKKVEELIPQRYHPTILLTGSITVKSPNAGQWELAETCLH